MTVEKHPAFTDAAEKLWSAIPIESRKLILSKVWCSRCTRAVTIKNFSGAVKAGDLLLVGECSECHGDVARLIETSENQPKS